MNKNFMYVKNMIKNIIHIVKHVRMIYVYYAKKIIDCIKLYHMMMLFRKKKLLEKMR